MGVTFLTWNILYEKCIYNLTEITLFENVSWKTHEISRYQASYVLLTKFKFSRVDSSHFWALTSKTKQTNNQKTQKKN